MEKITIPTQFNIDVHFYMAPFHKRLLAWVVDMVIIAAYVLIFYSLVDKLATPVKQAEEAVKDWQYNIHWLQLIVFVPVLLYHFLSEWLMNGQSIGKKILGIKVMSADGKKAALHQYLLRWLLRLVDISMNMGVFATISIVVTKKAQRIGDVLANTIVIATQSVTNINNTVFLEVEENYKPVFTNVLLLSDRDMNIIKNVVAKAREKQSDEIAYNTANKVKEVLHIQTALPSTVFLETILKDYNALSEN